MWSSRLEKLNDDNTTFVTIGTGVTGSASAGTGQLTFADLSPGEYRLTETKTAAGYTLLSEAIEFTLTTDGKCKLNGTNYDEVTQDPASRVYNIALTIYNRKGFYLAAHGRGRTQPVAADRFARTGGCAAGAGVPIQ